jgi:hypothetical protein
MLYYAVCVVRVVYIKEVNVYIIFKLVLIFKQYILRVVYIK